MIRVLIVDDLAETRQNVAKLLQFEPDIEVIGNAKDGQEAIDMAIAHTPDVVLMDINMPGMDGISASRSITQAVPTSQIVIMSVQSEADYLRQAMLAGARDFLMKPFGADELASAIRSVYKMRPTIVVAPASQRQSANGTVDATRASRPGNVVTVFSPKGGMGCTTVAVNLAVSLSLKGHRTILVDGRLQFGDVSVMLNLKPTTTILDLIDRIDELDADLVESVALTDSSGLKVLLAPPRPEMAELVTSEHVGALLNSLRNIYDFVIVDSSSHLSDTLLNSFDRSDRILLLTQQSLPSLKSVSHFFDLASGLDYDPGKIILLVNNASSKRGVSVRDISDILKRPVWATIPADEPAASMAADRGQPLVTGATQKRQVALALSKLADLLAEDLQPDLEENDEQRLKSTRLGRLFGSR